MAPQFAEAVRLANSLFFQPIYDVETLRMIDDGVALLGDAAFVARPHLGAGVTKGFSDAMALGQALDRNISIEHALQEFETERLPIGRQMVERARQLGAYMQASRSTDEEKRAAEGYRTPEAVIRETASLISCTAGAHFTSPLCNSLTARDCIMSAFTMSVARMGQTGLS